MSLRNQSPFSAFVSNPSLTAAAGAAVLYGLPIAHVNLSSTLLPMGAASNAALPLFATNIISFVINCTTVSIPGRLDGADEASMRHGNANPSYADALKNDIKDAVTGLHSPYVKARDRSLITPSPWAFSIWGPIYLGETIFCVAQCIPSLAGATPIILPHITAPFAAMNLFQSLWCASFRPESFDGKSWTTFLSPAMLAGATYSMSQVNAFAAGHLLMVPLTMHFGWLTAATLVNLNSAVAAVCDNDNLVALAGHASVILASALGVAVTLTHGTPAYGATLAWALAACGSGMVDRINKSNVSSTPLSTKIQKYLCFAGAGVCAAASLSLLTDK
ncbi:hypothetical protein MPSEU_000655100 [Mayamaea pseudoterrestris]|nr:hypothetical protein MPSEU_000655100 [Mayamaea pseudoterrestris]